MEEQALVLLSGGQDSSTCLAWAINKWGKENVETISFSYGQRHKIELECVKKLTGTLGIKNFVYEIGVLKWNKNALTDTSITIANTSTVPTTFVPYRNVHFLLIASTYARSKGIKHLVTGVCETDFSGYKDCRDDFIKKFNAMINSADDYELTIHTPLMWLTKAKTVLLMKKLGMLDLYKYTHTCYEGRKLACGTCPACILRRKGFEEADIKDPLEYEK